MSAFDVKTYNQFEPKTLQLILDRAPAVEYFCTSAPLPGITATAIRQPSPFTDVKVTGDKLIYQPLIVTFIVDEHLQNWQEIYNWFVSYAHPEAFEQYADKSHTQNDLYRSKLSNATLIVANNKYNKQHEFRFVDLFPVDMSDIILDVQISDTQVAMCTVTFEYSYYYKSA